jgi:hypothetical protein
VIATVTTEDTDSAGTIVTRDAATKAHASGDDVAYSNNNIGLLNGPHDAYLSTTVSVQAEVGDTYIRLTSRTGLRRGSKLIVGTHPNVYQYVVRNLFTSTGRVDIYGQIQATHNVGTTVRTPYAKGTTNPLPTDDTVLIQAGRIGNGSELSLVDYGTGTWHIRPGTSYVKDTILYMRMPHGAFAPTDAYFTALTGTLPAVGAMWHRDDTNQIYIRGLGADDWNLETLT